jgi:hypothetical protein
MPRSFRNIWHVTQPCEQIGLCLEQCCVGIMSSQLESPRKCAGEDPCEISSLPWGHIGPQEGGCFGDSGEACVGLSTRLVHLTQYLTTSPHLTSPHLTSPHPHLTLTSPSPHLTSPHLTLTSPSPHLTSPHLTSPHLATHLHYLNYQPPIFQKPLTHINADRTCISIVHFIQRASLVHGSRSPKSFLRVTIFHPSLDCNFRSFAVWLCTPV